jgi:M6 family metalloprotease-like protein
MALLVLVGDLSAATVPANAAGEEKVLVIMARFPDVEPTFAIEAQRGKYFVKLDRYLRDVSYGKAWITGKTTDWYTLPHPVADYRLSPHNLAVEKDKVRRLIQDALDQADKDEDFSQYSMLFISLGAKRSDYGMMGLCGYPGMLGWQNELPVKTQTRGQKIPGGVAIYCEDAHVGVVFHDMAHVMGGVQDSRRVLPCLYDHDLQSQAGPFRGRYQFYLIHLGFFDPMSCHFCKFDQGPPGPCAWTRLRLGWIEPRKLVEVPRGESKTLVLGPLNSGKSEVQVVKLPIDASTYYLIENRQPVGADAHLPSHGVLISYCDDRVAECRHGKSPVTLANADPSTPELRGAPFTPAGKSTFQDRERGVSVKLLAQRGDACQIAVANGR